MKKAARTTYLDLARILAACAVVCIHTAGVLDVSVGFTSVNWWISTIVVSLCIWAVPVFVMISGALLLTKVEEPREFYNKRIQKILVPTVFWLLFYFVINSLLLGKNLSILIFIKNILYGEVGHLYFLLLIVELYAITPFLKKILHKLSSGEVLFLIGLFFIVSAFWGLSRFSITLFIPYIGYYIAGFYLMKYKLTHQWVNYFLLLWLGLVSTISATKFFGEYFGIQSYYYFTHGNPLIITLSITTFLICKYKLSVLHITPAVQKIIAQLADKSFGIYLIHPVIISLLTQTIFSTSEAHKSWSVTVSIFLITISMAYCITFLLKQAKYLKLLV